MAITFLFRWVSIRSVFLNYYPAKSQEGFRLVVGQFPEIRLYVQVEFAGENANAPPQGILRLTRLKASELCGGHE